MHVDIFFLSNIIVWAVNLISLIIACLYCYRENTPGYLKIFPVYLFVSIGIEVFANAYLVSLFKFQFFATHLLLVTPLLYNFFTVFETLAFSWFLFQLIRSVTIKKMILLLLFLFVLFFIRSSLANGLYYDNYLAVLFESVIIIILCLTFYRELFARLESVDLLKEPSFWLVTGIFFYLATIFPLFLTRSYLQRHGLPKVAQGLYSINNFALSVTYLLFTKGYTCRTKK